MRNILVIEDDVDVRAMVVTALMHNGYYVREARNGREGIQMVLAQKPDLIISDVKMPDLDGYSMLAAIRKCPGTAAIPFILMTGSMGRDDYRRGMVCGADDYLVKPFSAQEVVAAVESRLARQAELEREAFQRMEKLRDDPLHQFAMEFATATNSILIA